LTWSQLQAVYLNDRKVVVSMLTEIQGGLKIKEAAEETGLSEDTIRYYERIGLLPRIQRKENSHRLYGPEDIEKMRLIRCLKKTGMSLDEMKPFLNLSLDSELIEYPELRELLDEHKQKIEKQMASLQQIIDLIDSKLTPSGKFGRSDCSIEDGDKQMPKPGAKRRER
jgi:MerR family copper efflux transcriptional regulator